MTNTIFIKEGEVMAALSNPEKQAAYYNRQKEKGLRKECVYIPDTEEAKESLRSHASKLVRKQAKESG